MLLLCRKDAWEELYVTDSYNAVSDITVRQLLGERSHYLGEKERGGGDQASVGQLDRVPVGVCVLRHELSRLA